MKQRIATEIVTTLLVLVTSNAVVLTGASPAWSQTYKIELQNDVKKTLVTRTIDTTKPASNGVVTHLGNGLAFELADASASCGVFLEPTPLKTSVMVSLIENGTKTPKNVVSNSGVLTKAAIDPKDQDVLPGAAGARTVSVEAAHLGRTCTVSIL